MLTQAERPWCPPKYLQCWAWRVLHVLREQGGPSRRQAGEREAKRGGRLTVTVIGVHVEVWNLPAVDAGIRPAAVAVFTVAAHGYCQHGAPGGCGGGGPRNDETLSPRPAPGTVQFFLHWHFSRITEKSLASGAPIMPPRQATSPLPLPQPHVSSSKSCADNWLKTGTECRAPGARGQEQSPRDSDPADYPASCLWGCLPTCEPGRRGWVPHPVLHSCGETGVTKSPSSPGPLGPALHPRGCLTSWR